MISRENQTFPYLRYGKVVIRQAVCLGFELTGYLFQQLATHAVDGFCRRLGLRNIAIPPYRKHACLQLRDRRSNSPCACSELHHLATTATPERNSASVVSHK